MIRKIHFLNFQSHKSTIIALSKYVNIFTGSSDKGKSALMRGILWFVKNRPVGDGFRRHYKKKGEKKLTKKSFIRVLFSNKAEATRYKSNDENSYRVKGIEDPLIALRTDVPSEVSELHNMASENMQSQDEEYFLLKLSAGKVAKKLNKVAGLEQMDKALQEVNSRVRRIKNKRNSIGELIADVRIDIAEISWVADAKKLNDSIQRSREESISVNHTIDYLEDVIVDITTHKQKIATAFPQAMFDEFDVMVATSKEYQTWGDSIAKTSDILTKIETYQKQIINIPPTDPEIPKLIKKYEDVKSSMKELKKICDQLDDVGCIIVDLKIEIGVLKQDYKNKLKVCGKCPTCGTVTK